jgi:septal ring factor EnvC (AmiA/AmiB activator)
LDVATIGSVIGLAGVLSASVVAYLGKRGENATARMNSEIDQIQEERDGLRKELGERNARVEALLNQRVTDQETIARLRVKVINLGGDP